MVLNAGNLNRRIQIKRFIQSERDQLGNTSGNWQDHGTPIFARRLDVADAERMRANAWDNQLVVRFVIRATAFAKGIKRSDMIAHEGVAFGIDGIKEVPGPRGFLEITALTSDIATNNAPFEV